MPQEFTRLDSIIDLVFATAEDAQEGEQGRLFDLAIQHLVQSISTRNRFRKPFTYNGPGDVDIAKRRGLALSFLEHVITHHNELLRGTALDFYNILQEHAPKCIQGIRLPTVNRGGKLRTCGRDARGTKLPLRLVVLR